jgi:hypothetical protein
MTVMRTLVGLVLCASASTVFAYGVNLEAQSKVSDDKMCLDVSRRRIGGGKKPQAHSGESFVSLGF